FGLLNTPKPAGTMVFATESGPGWASPDDRWQSKLPATTPLPREWAKYKGLYLHDKHVVLSYTVGDTPVLESPWVESAGGTTALTRTLEIGPSRRLHLFLCDVPGKVEGGTTVGDVTFFAGQQGNRITAVALVPQQKETFLHITNAGRAELIFAPRRET